MTPHTFPLVALLLAAGTACSGGTRDAAGATVAAATAPAQGAPSQPTDPAAARARAEGEFWAVALEASGPQRAGEPAEARIRVSARGGYHVNEEYPMSFRPAADATVRFSGERVALAAREKSACGGGVEGACEVTAALPYVPVAAGEARLSGTVAFSVCTKERCLVEKTPLAVSVAAR